MRILTIREEDITLAKILKDSGHVYKGPTNSYTMDEVIDIVASIFGKGKNTEIRKKYDRLLGSKDIDYSNFNDSYHSQFRLDHDKEDAKRKYSIDFIKMFPTERFIVLGTNNDLAFQINQLLYDIREGEVKYKYYNSRSRTVVDETRDVLARTIKIKQQNVLALYQTYLCNELFNILENHIIESY